MLEEVVDVRVDVPSVLRGESQDVNPVVLADVRVDVLREESQGANPVVLAGVRVDVPNVQDANLVVLAGVPDVQSAGKLTQFRKKK